MKKEDKELLLRDLCARLPYRPYVLTFWKFRNEKDFRESSKPTKLGANLLTSIHQWANNDGIKDRMYKPYLFPLSSMTGKHRAELFNIRMPIEDNFQDTLCEIDFYHRYHFDYRGLIEKGLAIDATGLNIY